MAITNTAAPSASPASPRFDPAQVEALQERCMKEFERAYKELPDIRIAAVSTIDGRAFAAKFAREGDAARIGAMSSALLALCETMAKEMRAASCKHVVVAAQQMNIVVVRIAAPRGQFSLVLGAAESALLAVVLRMAIDCAERLKKILVELR